MNNELKISKEDNILIVAPHPDDETIGCGGILSIYGPQCDVLLLTDGRYGKLSGRNLSDEEIISIRKKEFEQVMTSFGVRKYKELAICDSKLKETKDRVSQIDLKRYQYIFVPNRMERHPDHKAAFDIFKQMHRSQKSESKLLEYEVWSPIIAPNLFLDISEIMDQKIGELQKYKSQIEALDYERLARGLNGYRAAPHHVKYCEAYYDATEEQKLSRQKKIEGIPLPVRKMIIYIKRVLKS